MMLAVVVRLSIPHKGGYVKKFVLPCKPARGEAIGFVSGGCGLEARLDDIRYESNERGYFIVAHAHPENLGALITSREDVENFFFDLAEDGWEHTDDVIKRTINEESRDVEAIIMYPDDGRPHAQS